jgi:hypothetical protein
MDEEAPHLGSGSRTRKMVERGRGAAPPAIDLLEIVDEEMQPILKKVHGSRTARISASV